MVDQILQNLSELRNRTSQLEKKTSEVKEKFNISCYGEWRENR